MGARERTREGFHGRQGGGGPAQGDKGRGGEGGEGAVGAGGVVGYSVRCGVQGCLWFVASGFCCLNIIQHLGTLAAFP